MLRKLSATRRLLLWIGGATAGVSLAIGLVAGCLAGPSHRGPPSQSFDGRRFVNEVAVPDKSLRDMLRWWWTRRSPRWQERLNAPAGSPPPERISAPGALRVTFVNHATVLLQVDGVNLLTDPVYSQRIGPVPWAGPRRYRSPGTPLELLPPIDAVLVSHNHYDHFDVPTLKRLHQAHRPRIIVPLGNLPLLTGANIEGGHQLDWQQSVEVGKVTVTLLPARHWSGRGMTDRRGTLWGAYVLQTSAGPIYFAGDTGYGPHFAAARAQFGPMRLALLPIGAYEPRWFMQAAHISPAEAVRAHLALEAETSVAIHFGTFKLSDEGQDQPAADLKHALAVAGAAMGRSRFLVLEHGEGRDLVARATRAASGSGGQPRLAPLRASR